MAHPKGSLLHIAISLTLIFVLSGNRSLSQNSAFYFYSKTKYDTAQWKHIMVDNYTLYATRSTLSSLFKQADSLTAYHSVGDCANTALNFKNSKITFCDSVLSGFDITDTTIKIRVNDRAIKVGDSEKTIQNMFPTTPLEQQHFFSDPPSYYALFVYYPDNHCLMINFSKEGKVSGLRFFVDNSE
jgi:hypothetical protein